MSAVLRVIAIKLGPRWNRQKNFEIWTRYKSAAQNENHGSVILCVAVLVIDCYSYMGVLRKNNDKREAT
jgi:hypothetical protein